MGRHPGDDAACLVARIGSGTKRAAGPDGRSLQRLGKQKSHGISSPGFPALKP